MIKPKNGRFRLTKLNGMPFVGDALRALERPDGLGKWRSQPVRHTSLGSTLSRAIVRELSGFGLPEEQIAEAQASIAIGYALYFAGRIRP